MKLIDNQVQRPTPQSEQVDDMLVMGACAAALLTLIPIALYQTGLIRRLPDPPLLVFDSEKITMSDAAHPGGIPDSLLGLTSYSTTAALIFAAKQNENLRSLLGAKLALDLGAATFNSVRQVVLFRRLCSWCVGTAAATAIMAYAGRGFIAESITELKGLLRVE